MKTDELTQLVHLAHKLHQSLKAGDADLMGFDLTQVSFDEVEDFAFVIQMANAMNHSK